MSEKRVYFCVAMCNFYRSCHAAKFCDEKSKVRSGDFTSRDSLKKWIAEITIDERRCRGCGRPIALKHFAPRYFDAGALYSYSCEHEVPVLGWWPDGVERR